MAKKISEKDIDHERRRQRALQRLGSEHPLCVVCGEGDWRCLELHHLAGAAYDELTVILCRNCHRKQSNPSENNSMPTNPPVLERIGHLLLGLGEFLMALAAKLIEFGNSLLEGVQECPFPWGNLASE